jgi:hypothetical protein
LYITTALAHTVNLGLFDVESFVDGGSAYDGGNREDTLSSYTRKYYIGAHSL